MALRCFFWGDRCGNFLGRVATDMSFGSCRMGFLCRGESGISRFLSEIENPHNISQHVFEVLPKIKLEGNLKKQLLFLEFCCVCKCDLKLFGDKREFSPASYPPDISRFCFQCWFVVTSCLQPLFEFMFDFSKKREQDLAYAGNTSLYSVSVYNHELQHILRDVYIYTCVCVCEDLWPMTLLYCHNCG